MPVAACSLPGAHSQTYLAQDGNINPFAGYPEYQKVGVVLELRSTEDKAILGAGMPMTSAK